jgi:hypothetical protein
MTVDPNVAWAVAAFAGKRSALYQLYAQYLAGNHPLAFATGRFRTAFGRTFKEFSYNRCATVVDAHADRLQISGWDCGDETLGKTVAGIWAANNMDYQEGQVEREQFAMGDAYVIVEADPDTPDIWIWPQEADAVRVRYSQERPGRITMAAKRWTDDGNRPRLTLYFEDRMEKYARPARSAALTQTESGTPGGDWSVMGDWAPVEDDSEPWPLPLKVTDTVPVFHFANNAPIGRYGQSELSDVIPLQNALNKQILDMLVASEIGAFRQRYGIDLLTTITDQATGEEVTDPLLNKMQAGMLTFINFMSAMDEEGIGKGQIGEFSAADLVQYNTVVDSFDKRISKVSRVPTHYLEMTGEFPSGEALRLAETPFLKKMDDRVRAATPKWAEVARYAARLTGAEVPPGKIKPKWEPVAPLTQEEQLNAAVTKYRDLDYPQEEALVDMGTNPDHIKRIVNGAKQAAEERAARSDRLFGQGIVPALRS